MTENIGFQITDGGTIANVQQLLVELGLTGAQALQRIQSGYTNLEVGAQEAANSQKIYASAVSAGLVSTVQLYQALDKLTNSEINLAATSNNLSRLQTGIATGFSQTRSAALQVTDALNQAAAAQTKAADATGGFSSRANAATSALTSTAGAATSAATSMASLTTATGSAGDGLDRAAASSAKLSAGFGNLSAGFQKATSAVSGLVSSLVAYLGIKGVEEASDEYTNLHNKLALVVTGTAALATEQAKLGQIANNSQTSIEAVVNTFVRFRSITDAASFSVDKINQAVQGLSVGLVLTGTQTGEAGRVMKDFTEALASGELQGRQLNSVLQQSPAFASLLAQALGLTVAQLKENKVGSDDLVNALAKIGGTYQTISAAQTTFSGALTVLHNNFVLLFADAGNASTSLTLAKEAIVLLANNLHIVIPVLEALGTAFIALKIAAFTKDIYDAVDGIRQMLVGLKDLTVVFLTSPFGIVTVAVIALTAAFIALAHALGFVTPSLSDLYKEALSLLPTGKDLGLSFDQAGKSASNAIGGISGNTGALNTNARAAEGASKAQQDFAAAQANAQAIGRLGTGLPGGGSSLNKGPVSGGGFTNLGNGTSVSSTDYGGDYSGNFGVKGLVTGGGFGSNGQLDSNYGGDYANRDGGVYRIPGGTGVDSVPLNLRVSPGEVVHVMTPMQAMGQGFRNGGAVSTGAGVSLGTSTTITAANQNVTGYTAAVAVALPAVATAVTDNTAAVQDNTTAITTATTTTPIPTGPAYNNLLPQYASGSVTDSGSSGGSSSSSNSSSTDNSGSSSFISGYSNTYKSQGISTASTNGSVDRGTPSKNGVVINNVFVPNGYYKKNADGTSTYNPTVMRDGGDMYMHGGSGVDSKMVQMAVSPGESIHVRTPSQRAAAQSGRSGNVTQNIIVHAANVREFGNSQGQVVAHAARAAQVAARKTRG